MTADLHPNRAGWLWCVACGVGWMPSPSRVGEYIQVAWPSKEQLHMLARAVGTMLLEGVSSGQE